jgi:non-specific serine/threonine protein kinase
MGVVYAGRDERLGREVAVKMIAGLSNEVAIKRFWREARAAAAISHPNVCQIYEVDESADGIYLAMELLEGQSLEMRLAHSPCAPTDAIAIALDMLGALGALHERGLVHRDIKPSNVFITKHGAKLLDFGLAREISEETVKIESDGKTQTDALTTPGMVVGTPRYMSPEQLGGKLLDGRTDIYSVGCVLFEMLAGRPPFAGNNVFGLAQAILHENPPALQGPPAVVAIDRVIRRALSKDPAMRFPLAESMATELQVIRVDSTGTVSRAAIKTLLRLMVQPFRMLRDDPDAAFLSYGLAEAISGSLASLQDVVVRSPTLAGKSEEVDPRELAKNADVDVIVNGSISRMGEQLRANVQLVEAHTGTVAGSTSVRGDMKEIFRFEDDLTKAVIGLLTPLRASGSSDSGGGARAQRDVPANGRAFEYFLRGLELARKLTGMAEARTQFLKALEEDPAFAPAWAWVGRCHRVIGKFIEDYEGNIKRAEDAFRRALALSPDLPIAHRFFTHFESEHGRADAAIARLLQHAKANRNDAQLFAALCHACRYAGLLGASLAAHEEAKRLDPTVPTSVEYSLLLAGDEKRLRAMQSQSNPESQGAHAYLYLFAGRKEEVRKFVETADLSNFPVGYRNMLEAVRANDPQETLAAMERAMAIGAAHDPEAVLLAGMAAVSLGLTDRGVEHIYRAVQDGISPVATLEQSVILDPIRTQPDFVQALETARQRQRIALAVFERGDGPALLGISSQQAT